MNSTSGTDSALPLPQPPPPAPPASVEQQQLNGTDHKAPAARKPWLRLGAVALVVILAAVAYGFFGHGSDHKSLKDAGFTPVSGFKVETPAFRFEMPDTPTIEPVTAPSPGGELTGKAWTIKNGDMTLQVIAIDYGTQQDDTTAQAGFVSVVEGMARRSGGEIFSDERLPMAEGSGRRSVIKFDSGRIFTENYARGTWVVSISVGTTADTPPTAYSNLVSSFEFI